MAKVTFGGLLKPESGRLDGNWTISPIRRLSDYVKPSEPEPEAVAFPSPTSESVPRPEKAASTKIPTKASGFTKEQLQEMDRKNKAKETPESRAMSKAFLDALNRNAKAGVLTN